MRQSSTNLLLTMLLLVLFSSCKKETAGVRNNIPSSSQETINVKISSNQSYEIILAEAMSASISKQASHFSVSETHVNSETGMPVYSYIPAVNFTGTDEVILSSTVKYSSIANSIGSGCPSSGNAGNTGTFIQYTTLKITVGN